MASSLSCLSLCLLSLVLLSLIAQESAEGRQVPETADKQRQELLLYEITIPGLGRFEIGGDGGGSSSPALGDLDHSIPAATNAQYLPGADDTFIPNPGYEVPNPFHP